MQIVRYWIYTRISQKLPNPYPLNSPVMNRFNWFPDITLIEIEYIEDDE